jgi:hypothetical protein
MLSEILVVGNRPNGNAAFGKIHFDRERFKFTAKEKAIKAPSEVAAPHHPPRGVSILLTVTKGKLTIAVPAVDGGSEILQELTPGSVILFCDYAREPAGTGLQDLNRRYQYSGHWSFAGPEGAELVRETIGGEINPDKLEWKPLQ